MLAIVFVWSLVAVQPPPGGQGQPPRDARPATQAGSAVVRGRVLAADTGKPLRARITVSGEDWTRGAKHEHQPRRPLRDRRVARGPLYDSRDAQRISAAPVRPAPSIRTRQADPTRRQAGDRSGRLLAATRQRDQRADHRRARRAGRGRAGVRPPIDLLSRSPPHGRLRDFTVVASGRSACQRRVRRSRVHHARAGHQSVLLAHALTIGTMPTTVFAAAISA